MNILEHIYCSHWGQIFKYLLFFVGTMELLYEFNPWWESKRWDDRDEDIFKWESQNKKWIPRWIKMVSLKPFSLNFIVGPRQVGKTTGVKLLIKELLKSDNPYSILYLNLEIFTDLKEFREILGRYQSIKEENNVKTAYIFLDEVSKLEGWNRIVKAFMDLGKFKRDIIVATGSSTVNIMRHAEAFTGRRGNGRDIVVLPLSFPEFAEIYKVDISKIETNREKLLNLFKKYIFLGGFPQSINEKPFFTSFIGGIEREIENSKKSSNIAKHILSVILDIIPSASSYNSIANRLGISHKTVMEYLEVLENLFFIKTAFLKDNRGVNFRREKKIFFRDPYFYTAFSLWCGKEIGKDAIIEGVVQEHLYRKFNEIYYYRNSYEIDCIAGDLKIEVKSNRAHRGYPRNIMVLEEEDIPIFLVKLFRDTSYY